ncbi:hypothetical protein [Peribacillus simplex]
MDNHCSFEEQHKMFEFDTEKEARAIFESMQGKNSNEVTYYYDYYLVEF